ncbi:MAG: AbrB/MazE/SpoVT family DNA-binding domain-containing protein [Coriobacteriia bacterium]|nr:AbrB/MazE/SpoVT family DNA-binding domain-containing protein [Coriobacteriia bacterium]
MSEAILDLSTVTTNGQVTIPAEVRRLLGIKPGNKVLFFQRANGDVVIDNASVAAIKEAQAALAGVAEKIGWTSDGDVLEAVMEQRYGADA